MPRAWLSVDVEIRLFQLPRVLLPKRKRVDNPLNTAVEVQQAVTSHNPYAYEPED
jgi:hypothetical protein